MKLKKYKTSSLLLALVVSVTAMAGNNLFSEKYTEDTPSSGGKAYDENTRLINVGVGLGHRYVGAVLSTAGYDYGQTPVISVSYEQPWKQRIGPGFLGVGGYFGFQSAHYDYKSPVTAYEYNQSWNYLMLTGRATYHWDKLIFTKGEVYGGVLIGIRASTYTYSSSDPNPAVSASYKSGSGGVWPSVGAFVGARYYFTKKFGVYAEVGEGASYLTGGLTFKL